MIFLEKIELKNFRSHTKYETEFKKNINIILGKNGAGKTNILEAIYFFSSNFSHKTKKTKLLVKKGKKDFYIRETININKKSISEEKNLCKKTTPLIKTVIFSPENTDFINGDPEKRRHYIDSIISQYDPLYEKTLLQMNRILKQRAKVLKGAKTPNEMKIWNEQYAKYSENISKKRQNLILKVNQEISTIYQKIAKDNKKASLKIKTHPEKIQEKRILYELENTFEKEKILNYTNVGAKSDDIKTFLNNDEMKGNSSYGEQWSLMISFVLAVYNVLQQSNEKFYNATPLLLLDDAFTGLDENRRKQLVKHIKDVNQVIITCANEKEIPKDVKYNKITL
jgi:DNA replication and repair protein RecF